VEVGRYVCEAKVCRVVSLCKLNFDDLGACVVDQDSSQVGAALVGHPKGLDNFETDVVFVGWL